MLTERQVLDLSALFLRYGRCERVPLFFCHDVPNHCCAVICSSMQPSDVVLVLPLHHDHACNKYWVLLLLPRLSSVRRREQFWHSPILSPHAGKGYISPFSRLTNRPMNQFRISIYLEGCSHKYMFNIKHTFLFCSPRSKAAPSQTFKCSPDLEHSSVQQ